MEIKVCGMRDDKNIQDLIMNVNPNWMGLIFYAKSPRFVSDNLSKELSKSEIQKVGVFVNESQNFVLDKVQLFDLAAIQLHGNESLAFVSELKEQTKAEIWKVFSVDETLDWDKFKGYEDLVNRFLFDTSSPKYGGTGRKFDWTLLEGYPFDVPYMLSGGIDASSAAEIKELASKSPNLIGVDLNSKFELEAGLKDISLIQKFKEELVGLRPVN